MDGEIWAAIPGWSGYEASNLGRIRSVTRTVLTKQGPMVFKGRVLMTCVAKNHHPSITLHLGGKGKTIPVHRLVLLAFVGPPPPGMEACHYNCDWTDNRLENLRWDTPKANVADSIREGTQIRGEKSVHAKLTSSDVIRIRELVDSGIPQKEMISLFGVTQPQVSRIVLRKNWKHI